MSLEISVTNVTDKSMCSTVLRTGRASSRMRVLRSFDFRARGTWNQPAVETLEGGRVGPIASTMRAAAPDSQRQSQSALHRRQMHGIARSHCRPSPTPTYIQASHLMAPVLRLLPAFLQQMPSRQEERSSIVLATSRSYKS